MLNEIVGWVRERVFVGSPFCEALYYVVRKEAGLRYPNIPHMPPPILSRPQTNSTLPLTHMFVKVACLKAASQY